MNTTTKLFKTLFSILCVATVGLSVSSFIYLDGALMYGLGFFNLGMAIFTLFMIRLINSFEKEKKQ